MAPTFASAIRMAASRTVSGIRRTENFLVGDDFANAAVRHDVSFTVVSLNPFWVKAGSVRKGLSTYFERPSPTASERPEAPMMTMPASASVSGRWLNTRMPSRVAQISCNRKEAVTGSIPVPPGRRG